MTSYVVEQEGRVVGVYKIVQNQRDLGSHVANASFMVDPASEGKGIGTLPPSTGSYLSVSRRDGAGIMAVARA